MIYLALSHSLKMRKARYLLVIAGRNPELTANQKANLEDLPLRELKKMANDAASVRAFVDNGARVAKEERLSFSDVVGFIALLVTVVSPVVIPLLHQPLLYYEVSQPEQSDSPNLERFQMTIYNLGLGSAYNVFGSLNGESVRFARFTPEPYLSTHFETNRQVGNGFFEIDVLQPQNRMVVIVDLNATGADPDESVTAYVRSDQSIGYTRNQISLIFLSYIAFVTTLAIASIRLLRKF
jgi:hypothetical protein